jgi:hypothetical protein
MKEESLMGLHMSVCRVSYHTVTTMTLKYTVAGVTLVNIVATVTLLLHFFPLAALLTPLTVMWREEHLW